MRDLDPRTVNLRTLPLQTGRRGFVLNALFVQNNFRHAVKDKGVSNDTMEDRRQYIYRAFHYLEHNDIKSFKLDPRSFTMRTARARLDAMGEDPCRGILTERPDLLTALGKLQAIVAAATPASG